MRRLQSYDDPEQARGLSDQLEIQGIENQVLSNEGSHAVWVVNEADLEAATQLASRYTGGPSDASRSEAERIRKQREAVARPVRVPGVSQAAGRAGGGPPGTLTLALIVLSVAVGVLSGLGDSSSPVLRALFVVPITPDGYYPVQIDWTQPWRLLTPMLIHFGIMHLVFNMLWLYRLGSQIENVQGMRVLLGLVVLTQVPGALAQFQLSGPLFGGMSGVVYGLFGFTWMQARYASRGYALSDQDTIWIMGFRPVRHGSGRPRRERSARAWPRLRAAGRNTVLCHLPTLERQRGVREGELGGSEYPGPSALQAHLLRSLRSALVHRSRCGGAVSRMSFAQ